MGWMSWAAFYCETDCEKFPDSCINEKLYREMADHLVKVGFLTAAYNRSHTDDCWMENLRDEKRRLIADRKRFPSGIKNLTKYMHDRHLELGIYEGIGTKTCAGSPCSMDSIKIDYKAARVACNTWRVYLDIEGSWRSIDSIIQYMDDNQDVLAAGRAPGGWNDPDILVTGLPNVTFDQARLQMTLWPIWSSPLIMLNDLRSWKPECRNNLLNRHVTAIDQDPLGIMGKVVRKTESIRVYVKPVIPVREDSTSFAIAVVKKDELEFRVSFITKSCDGETVYR
uniref:Alpha-galactosidase n=1 Tax=Angiostrongylus cantonensis TaxID=6313 RepID=A0A158PAY6_ANGCA